MPQYVHQVILLYLSVLDARTGGAPSERSLVVELARRWAPRLAPAEIEAIVDTAALAVRSGLRVDPEATARELCETLPPGGCQQLLSDLGAIARADGHLTRHEAETIGLIRSSLAKRPPYAAGAQAST